jgi:hypothetical protein
MLFCPAFDMNCLHVFNAFHNIAICAGCGDLIVGSEEIALRDKTAKRHKENRYKILAEARGR